MAKKLTYEEAISVLPNNNFINILTHTTLCSGGINWRRVDVLKKIQDSDYIELAGFNARLMGYGIAIFNKNAHPYDTLFIQTDEKKLRIMEKDLLL